MQIKNKLTLLFTSLIAVILILLNLYIFISSKAVTENNFYSDLSYRINIISSVLFEKDEMTASMMKTFEGKFSKALPNEIFKIYDVHNNNVFPDTNNSYEFNESLINFIRNNGSYEGKSGKRQIKGTLYNDNEGTFVVIVSAVNESGEIHLQRLLNILIIGFAVSIVIVFITGRFFISWFLRPVASITSHANEISETNLHLRLDIKNPKDELGRLSTTINNMLERLEHAFDLQKTFVANASHEFRTPLTSIIGNAEVALSKDRSTEEYKQALIYVSDEAEKLKQLTNGLLGLAQSNIAFTELKKEEVRIDEILIEVKSLIKSKRPHSIIHLHLDNMPENPSELIIKGDKSLIQTSFLNIIDNAVKFSDEKPVNIYLNIEKNKIIIRIEDEGIGIKENEISHITETFYRGSNAREYEGSGIGLALTDKILNIYNGKLTLTSSPDKGTNAEIIFKKSSDKM